MDKVKVFVSALPIDKSVNFSSLEARFDQWSYDNPDIVIESVQHRLTTTDTRIVSSIVVHYIDPEAGEVRDRDRELLGEI